MPEDRLDDAIAAVTRAVERIEAATRGVTAHTAEPSGLDFPLPPQPRKPPPPAFSSGGAGFAARPTTALGFNADPYPDEPSDVPLQEDWSDYEPSYPVDSPAAAVPQDDDEPLAAEVSAAPAPAPVASPEPAAVPLGRRSSVDEDDDPSSSSADASVHELVGQVIARTQELEEHLDAARGLRSDITALVSRIAAAAERRG